MRLGRLSFTKSFSGYLGLATAALLVGLGTAAPAQDRPSTSESVQPTRHFRVERPADLTGQDALTIYARILDDMTAAYGLSGDAAARSYRGWRRYNRVPYRSATHGERFVNNYANALARAYGDFEAAGRMPEGALLAKDSFAVTARGDVFSGPLFLMEKMASGFSPASDDWRYSMIMPDGSLFGETGGPGSERVEFCHACHAEVGDADNLFFVPEGNRIRFSKRRVSPGRAQPGSWRRRPVSRPGGAVFFRSLVPGKRLASGRRFF